METIQQLLPALGVLVHHSDLDVRTLYVAKIEFYFICFKTALNEYTFPKLIFFDF